MIGPPWWNDRTVVLVGGGPSLRGFAFARLAAIDVAIVGINRSIFDLPLCAAGVSVDRHFVAANVERLERFARIAPLYLAQGAGPLAHAIAMRHDAGPTLSFVPDRLGGCTSGFAALNLALLKRARRILLLGFDYGAQGGAHHYHDAYPWHRPGSTESFAAWARHYETAKPALDQRGITVKNASPASAIGCFDKLTIEDGLAWASCRSSSKA